MHKPIAMGIKKLVTCLLKCCSNGFILSGKTNSDETIPLLQKQDNLLVTIYNTHTERGRE